LAKSLGIKVVPTFKLFKKGKEIAEVKGAKFDELVQKIEAAKAADS
jgi:thioredoxin-like negative regulator of GroEL